MKFLPLLLFLIPFPTQALTWNDLLNSYKNRTPYVQQQKIYDRGRYVAMCNVRVLREEYVPANGEISGHLKVWEEYVKVPCNILNGTATQYTPLNSTQQQYY
jgi:hypothetical protein